MMKQCLTSCTPLPQSRSAQRSIYIILFPDALSECTLCLAYVCVCMLHVAVTTVEFLLRRRTKLKLVRRMDSVSVRYVREPQVRTLASMLHVMSALVIRKILPTTYFAKAMGGWCIGQKTKLMYV